LQVSIGSLGLTVLLSLYMFVDEIITTNRQRKSLLPHFQAATILVLQVSIFVCFILREQTYLFILPSSIRRKRRSNIGSISD